MHLPKRKVNRTVWTSNYKQTNIEIKIFIIACNANFEKNKNLNPPPITRKKFIRFHYFPLCKFSDKKFPFIILITFFFISISTHIVEERNVFSKTEWIEYRHFICPLDNTRRRQYRQHRCMFAVVKCLHFIYRKIYDNDSGFVIKKSKHQHLCEINDQIYM